MTGGFLMLDVETPDTFAGRLGRVGAAGQLGAFGDPSAGGMDGGSFG